MLLELQLILYTLCVSKGRHSLWTRYVCKMIINFIYLPMRMLHYFHWISLPMNVACPFTTYGAL